MSTTFSLRWTTSLIQKMCPVNKSEGISPRIGPRGTDNATYCTSLLEASGRDNTTLDETKAIVASDK